VHFNPQCYLNFFGFNCQRCGVLCLVGVKTCSLIGFFEFSKQSINIVLIINGVHILVDVIIVDCILNRSHFTSCHFILESGHNDCDPSNSITCIVI
jgi:hypothetical protein